MHRVLLGLALLCSSVVAAQQQAPNLILYNGKIFTSSTSRPYVQALAIRGDRIVAIGNTDTLRALAGTHTRLIDLHGATAIPGINDAHHHFDIQPSKVDVSFETMDPTWTEVKDGIAAALIKSPDARLLIVSLGIGGNVFGNPSITRDLIDEIAPNTPVMLVTVGHGYLFNSSALRFYGVAENQPDPSGGRFERDSQGRLTGAVREYAALNMLRTAADAVPDSAAREQVRRALDDAAKFGITSIQELSYMMPPARAVKLLEELATKIRVRVVRMPGTSGAGRNIAEGKGMPSHPTDLVTVSGSKWLLDGVPTEGTFTKRGQWKFPSAPPFDSVFLDLPVTFPSAEIATMLKETLIAKDQLLVHVSGYLSAKQMLDGMKASGGARVWSPRRVCFELGDGLLPSVLGQVAQYGVVVVQNPSHLMLVAVPGGSAFQQAQPLKSLLTAGIPLAFGSDGLLNPYLNMMFATVHADRPSEAITREQAVIAYTLSSAFAEFQETEKGTLEPGKLADIAVLSQDIFTVPTKQLPDTLSVLTLVGGRIIYDAKH